MKTQESKGRTGRKSYHTTKEATKAAKETTKEAKEITKEAKEITREATEITKEATETTKEAKGQQRPHLILQRNQGHWIFYYYATGVLCIILLLSRNTFH